MGDESIDERKTFNFFFFLSRKTISETGRGLGTAVLGGSDGMPSYQVLSLKE
jgi:hypothetical protein